ncbi:MAG: hypothetical protein L3K13_06010, partial [Thermoplasmata archaeon]|nr:hypothetical protein [Thermoplasmata archaeon]
DAFAVAFVRGVKDTGENLRAAPRNLSVGGVEVVGAARELRLSWKDLREAGPAVGTASAAL